MSTEIDLSNTSDNPMLSVEIFIQDYVPHTDTLIMHMSEYPGTLSNRYMWQNYMKTSSSTININMNLSQNSKSLESVAKSQPSTTFPGNIIILIKAFVAFKSHNSVVICN